MTKQERDEIMNHIAENLMRLVEIYNKKGKRFPAIELIESIKTHPNLNFEERTKFLNL